MLDDAIAILKIFLFFFPQESKVKWMATTKAENFQIFFVVGQPQRLNFFKPVYVVFGHVSIVVTILLRTGKWVIEILIGRDSLKKIKLIGIFFYKSHLTYTNSLYFVGRYGSSYL